VVLALAESTAEFFPDAAWQRCVVHWYRNIFSHVPSTKVREIAAMLKAIHHCAWGLHCTTLKHWCKPNNAGSKIEHHRICDPTPPYRSRKQQRAGYHY
jgi:Transposase, Mutator family